MRLPKAASIAHLIKNNDQVDINLTRKISGKLVTETILKRIRVLSIMPAYPPPNQKQKKKNGPTQNTRPTTMVLAMRPKQSKQLTLAAKMGAISYLILSVDQGTTYHLSANGDFLTSDEVSSYPDKLKPMKINIIRGLNEKTVAITRNNNEDH